MSEYLRLVAQNVTRARCGAMARTKKRGWMRRIERNVLIGFLAANFSGVCVPSFPALFPKPASAQEAELRFNSSTRTSDHDEETGLFPKIRTLDLSGARALAVKRSSSIALANARIGAAQSDLKEQRNRFKLQTGGGLGIGANPLDSSDDSGVFTPKVRLYLSLDLERLLGLNKQAKAKAARTVEAEQIGKTEATNSAIKEVSSAWYALRRANTGVVAAARYRETAKALYVSADAKFKAGTGELSSVLSALDGTFKSEESYQAARQAVALSCLDLAQACGYTTAEEMEAAL